MNQNHSVSRQTKIRLKILSVLESQDFPIGLEEIHQKILTTLPKTAFSTVFRQVKKLESERTVSRSDWRERGSRFELTNRPHHHHIICQVCGKQADIAETALVVNEKHIIKQTGYTIDQHFFELEGICPACQKK